MARPAPRPSRSLVYSTEKGRLCPDCGRPVAECRCRSPVAAPAGDGIVRVSRQTKGRKGRGVTLVQGVPLPAGELDALAARLKRHCSSGGTVRDGIIEIQGDHRDLLLRLLGELGWKVKRVGAVVLLLAGATLTAPGCGTSGPWQATPAPAHDLPPHFVPDTEILAPDRAAEIEGTTCIVHLMDPRDGTRLELKRSSAVGRAGSGAPGYAPSGTTLLGDYSVTPPGRYGGGTGRLLRLLCQSGKPLGLVPAGD